MVPYGTSPFNILASTDVSMFPPDITQTIFSPGSISFFKAAATGAAPAPSATT